MKKILNAILMALTLAVLAGCATPPEPQERITYRFVRVPMEMTEKVAVKAPPDPVYYSQLPWDKQEALLMDLIQSQTTALGVCNIRLGGISKWSDRQALIYGPITIPGDAAPPK